MAAPFSISPATIPAGHAGNITLTLSGYGTSWQSGTTVFSLSGVSGVTKISQTIASSTSATIVITTGFGTGTLAVSDGTHVGTAPVVAPTFSLSPSTGNFRVPTVVTATGSAGSIWTQETASTLFSTPGTLADPISSINVLSDTVATFTLNPGTATGSLVVTEGPIGATSTYQVMSPGSLRFVGPLTLATTANSLLYNQSQASYSYFIQFNEPFGSSDSGQLLSNHMQMISSVITTMSR